MTIGASGGSTTGTDTIIVAARGYRPPIRIGEASNAYALNAWPERLGPNRNGRQW